LELTRFVGQAASGVDISFISIGGVNIFSVLGPAPSSVPLFVIAIVVSRISIPSITTVPAAVASVATTIGSIPTAIIAIAASRVQRAL